MYNPLVIKSEQILSKSGSATKDDCGLANFV